MPYCKCEAAKDHLLRREKEKALQFLLGLNGNFDRLRSNVLSMEPTPSLSKLFSLALQEEQSFVRVNEQTSHSLEGAAFAAKTDRRGNENTRSQAPRSRSSKRCEHCKKMGHLKEECFEIIGYPANWKNNQQSRGGNHGGGKNNSGQMHIYDNIATTDHQFINPSEKSQSQQPLRLTMDQYNKLMQILGPPNHDNEALANFAGKCNSFHNSWILDTGASNHMVGDKSILDNVKCISSYPNVRIANGSSLPVTHVGNAYLTPNINLKNVICVPGFKFNLLSIAKATKELNCSATFLPDSCFFQDLCTRMLIGVGRLRDGVYQLEGGHGLASLSVTESDATLWHMRLGHTSFSRLKLISSIPFPSNFNHICDVCHRAKQTRLSFSNSNKKSVKPFALIHVDLWGAYSVSSLSGAHYFLTIVDDFSRCTWVFLLKNKFQAYDFLTMFCQSTQT